MIRQQILISVKVLFTFCALAPLFPTGWGSSWAATSVSQSVEEQARRVLANQLSIEDVTDPRVWKALAGGDIIGNGGGIVEQRLFNSLNHLLRMMDQCLRNLTCPINSVDRDLLQRIGQVLRQNRFLAEPLIFISSQSHPVFFQDSDTSIVRSAKTGYRPELPIFINREHLYSDGKPSLSANDIIGLLVHELGHQAGEANHTRLDELGARIAAWVLQGGSLIERTVLGQSAQFQVINPKSPDEWPVVWLGWRTQSVAFSDLLLNETRCQKSGRQAIGLEISNIHWKRERLDGEQLSIPVSAWARVYCVEDTSLVYFEDRDLDFEVVIDRPLTERLSIRPHLVWR